MGTQAIATVPLTVAGAVVGAMSFSWAKARRLPHSERELFLAFGRQAAQALERARLFEAERAARADAEAARAAAEKASVAKSEFLAVMSHELRTPLNAIGGYAELLTLGIHGPVGDEQQRALDRIQQSQRHLLGLINQVLNYARIDAGAVQYDLTDFPVIDALTAAGALLLPQMRARGIRFSVAARDQTLQVRADRDKLQQILLNLLSNAVKFTEAGGEIRLSAEVPDESPSMVAIVVADTGIGIPPEKLETIFEPFVQVDQRLTRAREGVGLGLAISRELVRGMGGDLTARSRTGEGSEFRVVVGRAG